MIDIIDLGTGNVRSIKNILDKLQIPSRSICKATELSARTVILPGVGAAGPFMEKLKSEGFDKRLVEHHSKQGRIIGICLGFQLLTTYSEESGGTECLGLIEAVTRKLSSNSQTFSSHTGWESFNVSKQFFKDAGFPSYLKLTRKQKLSGRVFYNHEFGVCKDNYGEPDLKIENESFKQYSSLIVKNNLIGIQFHPEKSQATGLRLFEMIL